MIGFIIGSILGAVFGFVICATFVAAAKSDGEEKK